MIFELLIGLGIGAALGAFLASLRHRVVGACPLTANPRRGALYGGFAGLLIAFAIVWPSTAHTATVDDAVVGEDARGLNALAPVESLGEFESEVLGAEGRSAVYFHADWSPLCDRFDPVVAALSERFSDRTRFREVDIEQLPELAEQCGVQAVPALIVYRDGQEISRFVGIAGEERIARTLE